MQAEVDYLMIEGRKWVSNPDKRYSGIEVREPLITAIPRLQSLIMTDIPQAFSLKVDELQREDNPIIPRKVIREALCNALMHRDYAQGQPVQIRRYSNRIEFANAGYTLKLEDHLGLPGSVNRNHIIANVLRDVRYAEAKGTGIQTMRELMRKANLSFPLFESDRAANQFTLTLLTHHLFDERDIQWLSQFKKYNLKSEEARAMIILREMGAMTNRDYRTINTVDTLTASHDLRHLRNNGLIEQKGNGPKTYYIPTSTFLSVQPGELETKPGELETKPGELLLQPEELELLPKHLLASINSRKIPQKKLRSMIKALCFRNPKTLGQLSNLLKRNNQYLREAHLQKMIESKELEYTIPENPTHPNQAYKTEQAPENE